MLRSAYICSAALLLAAVAPITTGCCGLLSEEQKDDPAVSQTREEYERSKDFTGTYELFQGEGPLITMTVSRLGEGYTLTWETEDGRSWNGAGFAFEDVLAAAVEKEPGYFGIYTKYDSKLSGIFTTLEGAGYFTERSPGTPALAPSARRLEGRYNSTGFSEAGEGYEDSFSVVRSGQVYRVLWGARDDPSLSGGGLAVGDLFLSGVGVGGSIVVRVYEVKGAKLDGRYFYSYYDDMEFKEHFVTNGEIAEKE